MHSGENVKRVFMSRAFVLRGIACCVTHLYVRKIIRQVKSERSKSQRLCATSLLTFHRSKYALQYKCATQRKPNAYSAAGYKIIPFFIQPVQEKLQFICCASNSLCAYREIHGCLCKLQKGIFCR